jgi:ubiquinol-cytochrome c reductase cytochrome b subunit
MWGGFSLGRACLRRFFSLHFVLPLLVLAVIAVHLLILHEFTSSSPVRFAQGSIFSTWLVKDLVSFAASLGFLAMVIMVSPFVFMDPDNWFKANPLATPEHIKPEWYFLFAYCILRVIPDKNLRVLGLVRSLLVVLAPTLTGLGSPLWAFLLLTWLRGAEASDLYILAGQVVSVAYFLR